MGHNNEPFGRAWEPAGRLARAGRAALDVIYPHRSLDDDRPVQSPGLSAEAWSRIAFLDDPVCDGCGTPLFSYCVTRRVRCASPVGRV
jgi:hypothetical protein